MHAALHNGILAYLAGNEAVAVERVSYALSLNPSHKGLDAFLSQLELATGLKRVAFAPQAPERFRIEQLLTRYAKEGR